VGEHDDLLERSAVLILALRRLRRQGSHLAGDDTFLAIGPDDRLGLGPVRWVYPDGDGGFTLTIPFALTLTLQVLEDPQVALGLA